MVLDSVFIIASYISDKHAEDGFKIVFSAAEVTPEMSIRSRFMMEGTLIDF